MKAELIVPLKFINLDYPEDVNATIHNAKVLEVSEYEFRKGIGISPDMEYSLHTKPTRWLWLNYQWIKNEFFKGIDNLIKNRLPKIIEIHPPYKHREGKSDCKGIDDFLQMYSILEDLMADYQKPEILLENLNGSFVSNSSNIRELLDKLKSSKRSFRLTFVLDIPQLITSLKKKGQETNLLNQGGLKDLESAFEKIGKQNRDLIKGIHICGRKHGGTLASLFENQDTNLKEEFLKLISEFFDDDVTRYVVPEVNSKPEHFASIIGDLKKCFEFE